MYRSILLLFIFGITTHPAWTNDDLLEAISQVGCKGSGNEKLVKHWPAVKKMSSADIPSLLIAMNKANDLGDNWQGQPSSKSLRTRAKNRCLKKKL